MKSTLHIVAVVALMITGWAVGFSGTGRPSARTQSPERGTPSGSRSTLAGNAGMASSFNDAAAADDRRGRVLSDLLSAMQQLDEPRRFLSLSRAIAQIGPDDIQAVLEFVKRQRPDESRGVLPQIVARWAEFDPKSAAAFAVTLELPEDMREFVTSFDRNNSNYFAPWSPGGHGVPPGADHALAIAASEWARKDPAAAKAWALDLPSGRRQRLALAGIAAGMIASDPAGALAWMQSLPAEKRTDGLHSVVFQLWAEGDPQSASQHALALPPGDAREKSLLAVAGARSRQDPKSAFEWIQQIPEARARNLAAVNALGEWAKTDPDSAMQEAARLPQGSVRLDAHAGIITAVASGDSDRAVQLTQQLPEGQARTRAIASLVEGTYMNQLAPKTVVALAMMLPQGSQRMDSLANALHNLANESPKEALDIWQANLSSAGDSAWRLKNLLDQCASRDPHSTIEWMMNQPGVNESDYTRVVSRWAALDAKAALAWTESLPEGSRKTAAVAGTIEHLASTEPAQAAERLASLAPGEARKAAAGTVANYWVRLNADEASRWAATIADPALKIEVVNAMVHEIGQRDLPRAYALLETLPAGAGRDDTATHLIENFSVRDPATAAKWADRIGDEEKRKRGLSLVFLVWRQTDEAAAKRWLRTVPNISPSLRDELLAK